MEREPDGAIVEAREAVRLNESVGTTPVWSELNLAMIMVLGGHPEARRELRRIIQSTYDERQWTAFSSLLELPPSCWCRRTPRRQRRSSIMSDSAGLRARGAAMDRHEIAAFAINALAED